MGGNGGHLFFFVSVLFFLRVSFLNAFKTAISDWKRCSSGGRKDRRAGEGWEEVGEEGGLVCVPRCLRNPCRKGRMAGRGKGGEESCLPPPSRQPLCSAVTLSGKRVELCCSLPTSCACVKE